MRDYYISGSRESHYGYSGFQSMACRAPPELKPGETLESRDTKFSRSQLVGSPVGRKVGGSVSSLASAKLKASDYKVPDRRGISAQFVKVDYEQKPCQKLSTSAASYGNFYGRKTKTLLPEWVLKSQHRSDSIYGRPQASSYAIDLGKPNEEPIMRPYPRHNFASSTTTIDLCQGTTQAVSHLPGYSGKNLFFFFNSL